MIFIYALLDPETQQVRYVGKTKNLADRLRWHKNDAGETRKARWIRALRRRGLEPVMVVLDSVTDDNWQEAERAWIARVRELGADLTNLTDGGEGLCNASAETRAKLAAVQVAVWSDPEARERLLAVMRSPGHRAKISAALSGRKKSAKHVRKLPQNQLGRILSDEHRARISAGLLGKTYPIRKPITDAARAKISTSLRGNQHTKGRQLTIEEKRRRSETLMGRPKSAEWKEKIRQGQLRAWARRKEGMGSHHGELPPAGGESAQEHAPE